MVSSLPAEVLQDIGSEQNSYLAMRQTCTATHENMPLVAMPSIKRAYEGSKRHVAWLAALLLDRPEKKEYRYHAQAFLEQFLNKASSDTQRNFWGYFAQGNSGRITHLLDIPFDKLKKLSFATPSADYDEISETECLKAELLGNFSRVISKVVDACPNLEELEMRAPRRELFSRELLHSIMKSKKLAILDIGTSYFFDANSVLAHLSTHPSLKSLNFQLVDNKNLQEVPKNVGTMLTAFYLRRDETNHSKLRASITEIKEEATVRHVKQPLEMVKHLITTSPNLQRFFLNSASLLSMIPEKITALEVVLPENMKLLKEKIKSLQALEELSFFQPKNGTVQVADITRLLLALPCLTTLKIRSLLPNAEPDKDHWIDTLCRIHTLCHLECRIDSSKKSLSSLTTLCNRLRVLHLEIKIGDDERSIDTNLFSNIAQLFVTVTGIESSKRLFKKYAKPKDENFFVKILPFLHAVNPEELIFCGFYDTNGDQLKKIAMSADAQLNTLTRLKRIIFCGKDSLWKFDKHEREKMYETHEVEFFGRQQYAKARDL